MTKDQVEQYGGICDQIAAIKALKVIDTVQGSSTEIPYQKHTISIEGNIGDGENLKLKALIRKKMEIESAIEAIPEKDSTQRSNKSIVKMRVLGRMSWENIAKSLGYHATREGVRKAYNRTMKKYF